MSQAGESRRATTSTGGVIAYEVLGAAGGEPPVVLLHAVGLDRTVWAGWTGPLAAAGHRVIAVDLPGHGASDLEPGSPSLSGMAAAVAAVLAAEGAARAHLLGVSLGGMVAQTLAIARPGLAASLVLCCTMATIPDDIRPAIRQRGADARAGGMAAVTQPTIDRWISPAGRDDMPARRIRQLLFADDAGVFAGCWDAIADLDTVEGLAGLAGEISALVVEGGDDISVPPGSGARLAAALPGSELVTIPGAWHLGPYESPATFLDVVQPFLSRVLRSSRITLRARGAQTSMPQTKARRGLANPEGVGMTELANPAIPIRRAAAPLRSQAVDYLRSAIVTGVYKPGSRLLEKTLTDELGVSRTVIRESLRQLETERLVDIVPNYGPIVHTLTKREAAGLYEIRAVLEALAARNAAEHATADQVGRLRAALGQIREAAAGGDLGKTLELKGAFYDALVSASGNPTIGEVFGNVQARISTLRSRSLSHAGRPDAMVSELTGIVDAIDGGDSVRAARLAQEHVEAAAALALDGLPDE